MGKLSIAFLAILFTAAIYTPATADSMPPGVISASPDFNPIVTHMDVREYKGWKTLERYNFSYIDGFYDIYNPEESIYISVQGKSDKLEVDEANGFSVFATMMDLSKNTGKRAKVKYDANKHTWKIILTAPKDNTGEYKIVVNLFCKKNDSPCAETYGFGTQIDKTLPLQVR